MSSPLQRVVAWLREGYPAGVPEQDYVALLALLRRRLTDDEVEAIGRSFSPRVWRLLALCRDTATSITRLTDELPSHTDIERVRDHLAFRSPVVIGGSSSRVAVDQVRAAQGGGAKADWSLPSVANAAMCVPGPRGPRRTCGDAPSHRGPRGSTSDRS